MSTSKISGVNNVVPATVHMQMHAHQGWTELFARSTRVILVSTILVVLVTCCDIHTPESWSDTHLALNSPSTQKCSLKKSNRVAWALRLRPEPLSSVLFVLNSLHMQNHGFTHTTSLEFMQNTASVYWCQTTHTMAVVALCPHFASCGLV